MDKLTEQVFFDCASFSKLNTLVENLTIPNKDNKLKGSELANLVISFIKERIPGYENLDFVLVFSMSGTGGSLKGKGEKFGAAIGRYADKASKWLRSKLNIKEATATSYISQIEVYAIDKSLAKGPVLRDIIKDFRKNKNNYVLTVSGSYVDNKTAMYNAIASAAMNYANDTYSHVESDASTTDDKSKLDAAKPEAKEVETKPTQAPAIPATNSVPASNQPVKQLDTWKQDAIAALIKLGVDKDIASNKVNAIVSSNKNINSAKDILTAYYKTNSEAKPAPKKPVSRKLPNKGVVNSPKTPVSNKPPAGKAVKPKLKTVKPNPVKPAPVAAKKGVIQPSVFEL